MASMKRSAGSSGIASRWPERFRRAAFDVGPEDADAAVRQAVRLEALEDRLRVVEDGGRGLAARSAPYGCSRLRRQPSPAT